MDKPKRCNNPECHECNIGKPFCQENTCEPIKCEPHSHEKCNTESDFDSDHDTLDRCPQIKCHKKQFCDEPPHPHEKYHCKSDPVAKSRVDRVERSDSDSEHDTSDRCPPINSHKKHCDEPIHPRDFVITDEYLLDYLLKKYGIDQHKLVLTIRKNKELEFKKFTLKCFYRENNHIKCKPIKEQYKVFKNWNCSDIYISKEELEDYYEQYIK